jgi:hypothetical protein
VESLFRVVEWSLSDPLVEHAVGAGFAFVQQHGVFAARDDLGDVVLSFRSTVGIAE